MMTRQRVQTVAGLVLMGLVLLFGCPPQAQDTHNETPAASQPAKTSTTTHPSP